MTPLAARLGLALYNEWDDYAAEWLRNLIAAGHVAPGIVDTRSICDLRPDDLDGWTQVHLFAGIGGWSLAARLAGWPDDRPLWTGSCPCQPFSLAGRRAGFNDARHLWPHFARLIGQCRPAEVLGEQVASATEWLGIVRGDLEAMEYAVGCMPIEAAIAGADHLRDRYWFVGYDTRIGRREGRPEHVVRSGRDAASGASGIRDVADCHVARSQGRSALSERPNKRFIGTDGLADTERIQRPVTGAGASDNWHAPERSEGASSTTGHSGDESTLTWVIGADGKARRVKSGIRLLVNGVSGRVAVRRSTGQGATTLPQEHWYNRIGALRGFGNAIDPRPAAEFVRAYLDCTPELAS